MPRVVPYLAIALPAPAAIRAALPSGLVGPACAITARVAHDLGLAAWFGGATMGAVAVNAATREVEEHTQRLRVADAAWFRWAPVVAVAATAHFAGAVALPRLSSRRRLHAPSQWQPPASPLAVARTVLSVGAVLATLETGWSGRRVVAAGDVPVATAVLPVAGTPPDVARAQRRLRAAQWLVPAFTAGIAVIHAAQQETEQRRARLLAGVPAR